MYVSFLASTRGFSHVNLIRLHFSLYTCKFVVFLHVCVYTCLHTYLHMLFSGYIRFHTMCDILCVHVF
jgi:hypothetical protein